MAATTRYEGPCRRSGDGEEHAGEVTAAGRYRGLCGLCRPRVAAEQKQKRAGSLDGDGMESEVRARGERRGQLKRACLHLADRADRLEDALADRNRATATAKSMVRDFNDALQIVARSARALVGGGSEPDDG